MPQTTAFPITRRGALAAALAAIAWRPALAADDPGQADALHVLNRLAFGPAPGELERVTRMGASTWIAEQLRPDRIAMPSCAAVATMRSIITWACAAPVPYLRDSRSA